MKVDMRVLRSEDHEQFCKDFGAAVLEGFNVHSSGMSIEHTLEHIPECRGGGVEYHATDIWWAICSKIYAGEEPL